MFFFFYYYYYFFFIIFFLLLLFFFLFFFFYLIYFAFRYIRYISGSDSGACVCCASFECECMMTRMFALCMPVCSAADALVVAARC